MRRLFALLFLATISTLAGCGSGGECVTDEEFFAREVMPLLEADCIVCHAPGGLAGETRHVLVAGDVAANYQTLTALVTETPDGAELLLDKPTSKVSHVGGKRFDVLDPGYAVLHEFIARAADPGHCAHPGVPPPTCASGEINPGPAPLRRLTDVQIASSIRSLLAVDVPMHLLPATTKNRDFRTFATNNNVAASGAESLMLAAEYAAAEVDLDALRSCEAGEAMPDCTRRFVRELGRRAFRRDLTGDEEALLTSFIDADMEPDAAARLAIEVIIQSPQFLYLGLEATPVSGTHSARLDDYAIASRLSYFLLDSPPDDELMAAAAAGELRSREQVQAQARRLLDDSRLSGVISRFHGDWLNLYQLESAVRDADRYPGFGQNTIDSLFTEVDLFTSEVVWQGDGSFASLMFSTTSWIDSELAAIYGMSDPGPGWHRVELDDRRPGLLTRSAFLAAHAYSATSSPVRRGAFVLEQLLCEKLNPPADVDMEIPAESEEATTIRERLEQHWTDAACSTCHTRIDPVGFAFENFGALGEWRENWDNGIPVDASGELDSPAGSFTGAAEMLTLIASSDRAQSCYARRWFEYALGRPVADADVCSVSMLEQRFAAQSGDIRSLLVDIALTDAFLYRNQEDAQ